MKTLTNRLRTLAFLIGVSLIFLSLGSCNKNNDLRPVKTAAALQENNLLQAAVSPADLSGYKSSAHELSVGFYRTYGNHYGSLLDLPDSLDIVVLFGGWGSGTHNLGDSLSYIVSALHAKGIRVTYTGNLNLIPGASADSTGYNATAQAILDTIGKYNLDGFDIDVESTPSGSTLTNMVGVYTALSKHLGPKSGTSKLLTFDTNQPGTNSMFKQVYTMVSYVFYQDYGRGTSGLQNIWNTFSPYIASTQFIPGFSFYEENGYPSNIWYDVTYPENGTGRAYDLAHWEPGSSTKKGGVFGYAIDRDAPLTSSTDNTIYAPDYKVTNDLIQIMNPATGSGTTTGVVFYQDASYGGASTQPFPKGNYTMANFATSGMVNDWASSVKIPSGWTLTMYADNNFSGTSWTLTSDNSWFGGLSPSANDKVSSFKIQ